MVKRQATVSSVISSQARTNALRLSRANGRFLDYVEDHPELLEGETFSPLENLGNVQPFPVHGWPTFLSPARRRELHRINSGITALIRQVPQRIFGLEPQRLARFYGIEEAQAELFSRLLQRPATLQGLISRGDFYLTDSGFQCLECNLTGNLGGAGTDAMSEQILGVPAVRAFFEAAGEEPRIRDTVHLGFTHAVRHALEWIQCPGGIVHLLRLTPPAARIEGAVLEYVGEKYRRAVRAAGAHPGSRVYLRPYGALEVSDGDVVCDGERIHVVIEGYLDEYPAQVAEAAAAGRVALLNGPVHRILDDKRNLALLSEAADSGGLPRAEATLVTRHIPWARVVEDEAVRVPGREVTFGELLREERRELVLKPGKGMGGEGVALGSHSSDEEWGAAVEAAFAIPGTWIVQRSTASLPFPYQHGERGCVDHAVVWGAFTLGEVYGGGFLRVQPNDRYKPVNQSQGALSAVLFEAAD